MFGIFLLILFVLIIGFFAGHILMYGIAIAPVALIYYFATTFDWNGGVLSGVLIVAGIFYLWFALQMFKNPKHKK